MAAKSRDSKNESITKDTEDMKRNAPKKNTTKEKE